MLNTLTWTSILQITWISNDAWHHGNYMYIALKATSWQLTSVGAYFFVISLMTIATQSLSLSLTSFPDSMFHWIARPAFH